jgi:cholesterol oxidase
MAETPDLGVVDDRGAVHGYEGLYCIDGSIVPTSLGVNPSLTISALSERCAERLVGNAADLGLPTRPAKLHPTTPPQHIGERVVPHA